MLIEAKFKITFNLAGEDVVDEGVEGAATVYEREEHKYVAEEKDFTQPQFFVAEEVKSILRNVEEGYTLIKILIYCTPFSSSILIIPILLR